MLYEEELLEYEISPMTMAILPKQTDGGIMTATVLEESREYTVHTTPTKMIDHACRFFGSSLKGRLEGTKDISKITHKAPVAIDPSSGMYFFPTASPTNKSCSWIAHAHVEMIYPIDNKTTELVFKNGKRILLDVSYGSLMNQLHRTAQFRFSLDNRIQLLKKAIQKKNDDEKKRNE